MDTKVTSALERLRIIHDTLGRYEIYYSMMNDPQNTEGSPAYTIGDSLFVYGNPDHHSPATGIHLAMRRQQLIRSFRPIDFMSEPNSPVVRDTF